MLAPVLLPLFMFVHALFHTGNPVAEWSVVHTSEHSCTVHLDLVGGADDVDLAKLSLIAPIHLRGLEVSSHTSAKPSDQWKRNNTWNWMWNGVVPPMTLDFNLTWESCEHGTTPSDRFGLGTSGLCSKTVLASGLRGPGGPPPSPSSYVASDCLEDSEKLHLQQTALPRCFCSCLKCSRDLL